MANIVAGKFFLSENAEKGRALVCKDESGRVFYDDLVLGGVADPPLQTNITATPGTESIDITTNEANTVVFIAEQISGSEYGAPLVYILASPATENVPNLTAGNTYLVWGAAAGRAISNYTSVIPNLVA